MEKLRFDYIPLDKIFISDLNVRKVHVREDINELADSIRKIGIQQPIVVFEKGDKYGLLIGQRRYLACELIGLNEIPAIITLIQNDTDGILKSFSENIHRLQLDYQDKMKVATELLTKLGSIREVAYALGVSKVTVRNYLGYAAVPDELKQMVSEGKISAVTAAEISRNIEDEKEAIEIAKKVIEAPRGDPRRVILETMKENPDKNASEIANLASRQRLRKIILHITPKVSNALDLACRDFKSTPSDIASDALEEWLINQGFLKL